MAQLRTTLLTTPLGWAFVAAFCRDGTSPTRLLLWLAGFVSTWSLSLVLLTRVAKRPGSVRRDGWILYLAASLDGLAWGAMLPILAPHNPYEFLWLVVVLCGVIAVNAPVYTPYIRPYFSNLFCLYVVVLVHAVPHFRETGRIPATVGLTLFIGLIAFYIARIAAQVTEGLRLSLENAALAEQLQNALQAARVDAKTDALTGLANRRALDRALAEWQDAALEANRTFSVLMLDLDNFKAINDSQGHETGDEVLRAFAERVSLLLRPDDVLARRGGDEFVVVLPDADLKVAENLGRSICDAIQSAPLIQSSAVPVTVSVGVAQHRASESVDFLLAKADSALYAAKRHGRNCVRLAA